MAVAAIEIRRMKLADLSPSDEWILGFVEGEGCFTSHGNRHDNRIDPEFTITLRADDRLVLEKIQRTFGVGRLFDQGEITNKTGIISRPRCRYSVRGTEDCLVVIDFFEGLTFHSKKSRDFVTWAKLVRAIHEVKWRKNVDRSHIVALQKELRDGRIYA